MSQKNVEIVRRFYKSWSTRDLAGVLDCADAEFQFDWSASQAPFGGIYSGHEGFRWFWTEPRYYRRHPISAATKHFEGSRQYLEMWDGFEDDLEELIDAGDHVISVVTSRGLTRLHRYVCGTPLGPNASEPAPQRIG